MKIGMLFPGQGSQFVGMGKEFYDNYRDVQELFETASSCLQTNFTRLCFASSDKELMETANSQPAIFLITASIYTVLNKHYGITPDLIAGHSSGEATALYVGGGMNFADVLYLLNKRGTFMTDVTRGNIGSMLAVLGLPLDTVKILCEKYNRSEGNNYVAEIVNYNSSTQFVVAGTLPELELIKEEVRILKGKAISLNVSGAFHSRLMTEAKDRFEIYLNKVDIKKLSIPMVNNIDAKIIRDSDSIKKALVRHMNEPVLWSQSMESFKNLDVIVQIGPGKRFARILNREWPDKEVFAIDSLADLEKFLKHIGIKFINPRDNE